MAAPDTCYHCALPIPADCDYEVDVDGTAKAVCCPGCKAVAELVLSAGLENYYKLRDAPEPGAGRPEAESSEWDSFNQADIQDAFSEALSGNASRRSATIYVAGMYCSACGWLIQTALGRMDGVSSVEINPIAHRIAVEFDPGTVRLGEILERLARLGYKPQPLAPHSGTRPEVTEQRTALKRLLVASLGMMQVMMFAVALYAGDFQGIDANMQRFLRLVSFLVTTPVVFYSARPFFEGAIRGLRARQPGMDLPVSIAIGAAYAASVYSTFVNGEAVWFDSVTMFVFFLTVGRYLEMRARHRSIDKTVALSGLLPAFATRVEGPQRREVPVSQLVAGDRVRVVAGDSIPADGILVSPGAQTDEAILTGESRVQHKDAGDILVAGSINRGDAFEMTVRRTGVDTMLGTISRLSERARYARPDFVQLADRVASYIVVAILVIAAAVAAVWAYIDPSRAFVITLSVLVVTCPCALALATPAAFAAAGSRLSELKLLVTKGNAIEVLSRATTVVFDKTGTLTTGRPAISSLRIRNDAYDEDACRKIAASLEADSTHPLADAFRIGDVHAAVNARVVVGQGVEGDIDGAHWRLGKPAFAVSGATEASSGETAVWLANDAGVVAEFSISDDIRADAEEAISELRRQGLRIRILSGDGEGPVRAAAAALDIDEVDFECSPEHKLKSLSLAQDRGEIVVMVGDGINDAPVLAGADASIAPAHAAKLAQTSADVITLGDSLLPVATAFRAARQTMRIVRQNLAWAIVYNAIALPLAAAGVVPPWLAAIGMSASSLVVVVNALRLNRFS